MRDYFKIRNNGDGDIVTKAEAQGLYPDESSYAITGIWHPGVASRNATVAGNTLTHQGSPIVTLYSDQDDENFAKRQAVIDAFAHLPHGIPSSLLMAIDDGTYWLFNNYGRVDIYAMPLLCHKTLVHYNQKPTLADENCTCDNCAETETPPSSNHAQHSHRLLLSNGGTISNDLIFYHPVTWKYFYLATSITLPKLIASVATSEPTWNRSIHGGECMLDAGDVFVTTDAVGPYYNNSPSYSDSSVTIYAPTATDSGSAVTVPDFATGNIEPSRRLILIPYGEIENASLTNYDFGYAVDSGYVISYFRSWGVDSAELLNNFLALAGWTAPEAYYSLFNNSITKHPSAGSDTEGHLLDWMYALEEWNGDQRYWTPLANHYDASLASLPLGQALWAGRYTGTEDATVYAAVTDYYIPTPSDNLDYSTGNRVSQYFSDIANPSEPSLFLPLFRPNNGTSWANAVAQINSMGLHPWLAANDAGNLTSAEENFFNLSFRDINIEIFGESMNPKLRLHVTGDWALIPEEKKRTLTDTITIYSNIYDDTIYIIPPTGTRIALTRGSDTHGLYTHSATVNLYDLFGDDPTPLVLPLLDANGNQHYPRILITSGFFLLPSIINIDAEATRYPLLPH